MLDPKSLVFLALGVALLFTTDLNGVKLAVGPYWALFTWFMCVFGYLLIVGCILTIFTITQLIFTTYPIYTPVTSSVGFFIVYLTAGSIINRTTGVDDGLPIYPTFLSIAGAGLAIETLYIRFVLPLITNPHNETEADKARSITIGDRQLPVTKVLHIVSQEHYLQLTLINETILLRGRLGDTVGQLTQVDGLQPHRSWWVAAKAHPKLSKQGGKAVLLLSDGTEVPIAKARLSEVQGWLDRHSSW